MSYWCRVYDGLTRVGKKPALSFQVQVLAGIHTRRTEVNREALHEE
jgi:hypothetical protein